jgi:hypothetical protein
MSEGASQAAASPANEARRYHTAQPAAICGCRRLTQIAVLNRNVERGWDEQPRKAMEVASRLAPSNLAEHHGPKRAWSNWRNDG